MDLNNIEELKEYAKDHTHIELSSDDYNNITIDQLLNLRQCKLELKLSESKRGRHNLGESFEPRSMSSKDYSSTDEDEVIVDEHTLRWTKGSLKVNEGVIENVLFIIDSLDLKDDIIGAIDMMEGLEEQLKTTIGKKAANIQDSCEDEELFEKVQESLFGQYKSDIENEDKNKKKLNHGFVPVTFKEKVDFIIESLNITDLTDKVFVMLVVATKSNKLRIKL